MLYLTSTSGRNQDRDLTWYALWAESFKARYGSCVDISSPRWGQTNEHWTLGGIRIRDVNSLVDVQFLMVDGTFGWQVVGFSFDGVVCERTILNGKDLMNEIIVHARKRTGIDLLLKADCLESRLGDSLARLLDLGKDLTPLNQSLSQPGYCYPVEVSYESNAITSRMIAEDLAKKGSRTVNFKISSPQFDCLEGFYVYLKKFLTKNFMMLIDPKLKTQFKFKISSQLLPDSVKLTVLILAH